ncbi:MAG: type II CAAX prenyl endopeptidase Rce1 family protein [Deltaproteobacteria bacterium]
MPREWVAGIPSWALIGVTGLVPQLCLLAYPLLLARRRGLADRFRWPGFEKSIVEAALAIPVVLTLLMGLIALGLVLSRVAPRTTLTPEVFQRAAFSQDYPFLVVVGVLAVTVAPVCEEFFFRGFVHDALRSRMPVVLAAVVQSFLFAILHTFGTIHSIAVFFLGLILTAVYEWRKSLWASIFVHAGHNLFSVLGLALLMVVSARAPGLGVIGHDHPDGCQVDQVAPDTGAAKAGIAPGDVITDLDGQPVASFNQLAAAVRLHQAGDQVSVGIIRDGAHQNIEVVLGKRPPR